MRLQVDHPLNFWTQVWACRSDLSQAAEQHHVDIKLLADPVNCELVGHSFLSDAKGLTRWRWSVLLLFCNYVLELVLRLQWQQANQLLSGLLAEKTLWRSLNSDAKQKTTCLQSLLAVFKQLPSQITNNSTDTLTQSVDYWRPAFAAASRSIHECYRRELRMRWSRRVWVRNEVRYLDRITAEVARHDQRADQRWKWWHRLVGWWKNIDEKRRLIQLNQLQQVLSGWSEDDVLPTPEAVDDQLMQGCELGVTANLKALQRLSLQQHQHRGADMARESMADQQASGQGYDREITERLDVFKEVLEQKGCALVRLYFERLMQDEVQDLAEVWSPIQTLGKLYQTQLSRLMIDQNVPENKRNDYRKKLALYQDGVKKVLLQMVDKFSLNVRRLYYVKASLVLPAQTSDLIDLLQHYRRVMSFEPQAKTLYQELLKNFAAESGELNTVVKDKLLEQYTFIYQQLKESYWAQLESYEDNLAHHLALFGAEQEAQLLKMVREAQDHTRVVKSAEERTKSSLQMQGRFLKGLSQVLLLLGEIQPKFTRLVAVKQRLITYQRDCQVSLIGLQPQLASLKQSQRALSQYVSTNRRVLKAISRAKVPVLSVEEELYKTILPPSQPEVLFKQVVSVFKTHWKSFTKAHEQWSQVELPIRIRLSCEVQFRSAFTHDVIKDTDEVWLHYPRPRNHFLLAYDGAKGTWSVLGRDSQGRVHRFDLDLGAEPWRQYHNVLTYYEEGKARYSREYFEQVLCYPLLKRLALELGEPLFEFSDSADQLAYYPQSLATYLQKEFSRVYEKQVLPALTLLYKAKSQLRRARTVLAYLTNEPEEEGPLVAVTDCWAWLSRSMIADAALPEFPRMTPCRELVPYSAAVASTKQFTLEDYASLTPDEQRHEDFHRAVFDYLQLFYRLQENLLKVIRAHQCEFIEEWHEGVKQDEQLNADWQQLNRQYKAVWLISHPDRIRSELADIHKKARSYFKELITQYRKDIKEKNELIGGVLQNLVGFERYLRESYILGMDQGYSKASEYIDNIIYFSQRDQQHYILGITLKSFKANFQALDELRAQRAQAQAQTAQAQAQIQAQRAQTQAQMVRLQARIRELEAELHAVQTRARIRNLQVAALQAVPEDTPVPDSRPRLFR